MKKFAAFLLILLVCMLPAFAEDMAPLMLTSTRSYALGGYHVAYTDDIYALFVNPAALNRVNQKSVVEFSFAVDNLNNLTDVVKAIKSEDWDALGNFADKSGGKIPLGFEMRFPLSVGYAANGLGFGIWNQVSMDAEVIGTSIAASVYADFITNFGMSFSILSLGSHVVDAGFVVKPFIRAMALMDADGIDLASGGDDAMDKLIDEFNVPLIAGAGFDLGFMYRFRNNLAAGLTVDDVYTGGGVVSTIVGNDPGVSYRVPTTLNWGVAYTLRLNELWAAAPPALQPVYAAFMFDWRDFTSVFFADDYTRRNPVLNLGFGMEIGFFNFLKLRMGLNEMLPAIGLGAEFKAIQFNVAAYGKERGNEPGQMPTWALDLSFAIRPQSKERSWPWSKPIVNTILNKGKSKEPEVPAQLPPEEAL
jgi:hypothetical protein